MHHDATYYSCQDLNTKPLILENSSLITQLIWFQCDAIESGCDDKPQYTMLLSPLLSFHMANRLEGGKSMVVTVVTCAVVFLSVCDGTPTHHLTRSLM